MTTLSKFREHVETLAELLSWTSGEFTRYDDHAHPDHNRWSWQGDGHGFLPRTDCLPPRTVENAWMRRRPEGQEPLCGAGPINAQPCGLLLGHAGEHEVNDERQVR